MNWDDGTVNHAASAEWNAGQNPCASGSDLSPRRFVGWRVYGNQHGTWVKMPGRDYREMRALAATKGIAPEELLAEAIREHVERGFGD